MTVAEFDSHWAKRVSAVSTQSDKLELVQLLKRAGVGGARGGDVKAKRRRKVRFVQEIVGRDTGAPTPALISCTAITQVGMSVCA